MAGPFPRSAFLWRESLRWVVEVFAAGPQKRCEARDYTKNPHFAAIQAPFRGPRPLPSSHVQLPPRLPRRQPRRRAQAHGADCHARPPARKRGRPDGGRHPRRRRPLPARRRLRRHQRRGGRRRAAPASPAARQGRRPRAPLPDALARYLERGARLQPQGRRARSTPARPSSRTTCCATTTSSSSSSCTRPTRARSTPTSRSSRPAARSRCCATTASAARPSSCRRPRAARWCCATRATRSRATTRACSTSSTEALKRFATGTYAVWYPIIPRPEAHDLPRRLKTLATKAGKSWLHATLTVKSSKIVTDALGRHAPARACPPAACS